MSELHLLSNLQKNKEVRVDLSQISSMNMSQKKPREPKQNFISGNMLILRSDIAFKCATHLLWVQNFNDLCDGPRIKCWDNAATRRQKLQLECLWGTKGTLQKK